MTTCGDKADAELIGTRHSLRSVLPPASKCFLSQASSVGKARCDQAEEWMLLGKIKAADYVDVEAAIASVHPYSTPEIIEIGIEKGAQAYLNWIASVTERP